MDSVVDSGLVDAHRGGLGAAQRERRSADSNRDGIAARPHPRDDFALRARDETQIAKTGHQQLRLARQQPGNRIQPDDRDFIALAKVREGARIGRRL